jgi:hypothetical protein
VGRATLEIVSSGQEVRITSGYGPTGGFGGEFGQIRFASRTITASDPVKVVMKVETTDAGVASPSDGLFVVFLPV